MYARADVKVSGPYLVNTKSSSRPSDRPCVLSSVVKFTRSHPETNSLLTLLAIVIAITLPTSLRSQGDDILFDRISLEEGLSQSIVQLIIQDSKGFMWFGTEDGLNKYDGYTFTVYKHHPRDPNSLSHNSVSAVREDRSGVLWIGTPTEGLNKFDRDKETFVHFRNDPRDPASLSDNAITSIYEDRSGTLWIGTNTGGLNRLVPSGVADAPPTFTRYQNIPGDLNSLSSNSISVIYEDRSGVLWIGTNGGGLNKLVPSKTEEGPPTFARYQNIPGDLNSLSSNSVSVVYEDRSGVLWIGTNGGGLNRLVPSDGESSPSFVHFLNDPSDPNSLSHDAVMSIFEDESAVLWIGTNGGGLNKLVPGEAEGSPPTFFHYLNDPTNPMSLSDNGVYSIYQDRSGVIWIGTYGGGINRFITRKKQFAHYRRDPSDPNSLNNNIVWSVYEDRSGVLWIGTHGGGLTRFDRRNNTFTHYLNDPNDPQSLSHNIVRTILEDRYGDLWIGTWGGGVNKFDRTTDRFTRYLNDPGDPYSLSNNSIRPIHEDRSGALWIGTLGGGLNRFDRATGRFIHYSNDPNDPHSLSHNGVRSIHEDESGVLWIGTEGGGLNRFDRKAGKFIRYQADSNDPRSLSNDYIFSIYEDPVESGSILWVGTFGGGLNRFDRVKEEFTYYSEDDGLPNNVVYGILGDERGNLWLSTNNGLSKFNPRTERFRNYDVNDGLQSNEFNGGSYYKSGSGEMFFGGINGFNAFYPDSIKDNPYVPPIIVTGIKKFDELVSVDVSEGDEIELSYKDKYLTFEFVALDYTNPRKNQYAYRMEGFDEDWIAAGTRRFATYTNLDPGEYIFRVKGSNSDGVWNEEGVSVVIAIAPPFWSTWWFLTVSAVSLVTVGYTAYRRRVNAKLEKARIVNELKAAHDMQMALMPTADPVVEGFDISGICLPAEEVGGDYFDYLWLDDRKTKFGNAMGDVRDKAKKGAMTAVMTSGMIHSEARNSPSPRAILQKMNRPLYFKTDKRVFDAICFAVLDTQTRTLTFSNAGQPQPVLKRDGEIEYLRLDGVHLPVGLHEDAEFGEVTVQLKSGDVVIFYTDGIPEAMNEKKEQFDFERVETSIRELQTSITASEVIRTLLKKVERYTGAVKRHDDMTVVVVRVL